MEVGIGGPENSPIVDSRCDCNVEGNFHRMHYPLKHVLFYAVAGYGAAENVDHDHQLLPHNNSAVDLLDLNK